jgi:hypothetical protein
MLMATSAFATPPVRAADDTLTLYLQSGLHGPGFTAPFTPAPDIPPGAIVITVPLYPAAVPTAERESIPTLSYPSTPYLKSDGAAYLLPADPATALAWYRQAFVTGGYSVSGSGESGDTHTGASSLGITFASMSMKAVNLTVQLSLEADAQGRTIVYYEAEAITVPARDPRSLLPATVPRIDVTYRLPLGTKPPTLQVTLTHPGDIAALVAAFNALPRDGRGPHGCLLDQGEGATLAFVKGAGSTLTATIDPACSSVTVAGYRPLLDEGGRLWTTIKRILAATLSPAGMPISTSGRGKRQGECVPLIQVSGTISTCYLPGHQKEAEERLAPRPVNPVPAVARVYAHFPLRQVIMLSGLRAGLRGSPVSIVYVYGIPNNRLCPPGYHCPLIPTYLLVRETVGHLVGRGLRITGARQLDPATGRMADGPVELQANIPGRTLILHITTNRWQQDVLRIAQGILQAATYANAR